MRPAGFGARYLRPAPSDEAAARYALPFETLSGGVPALGVEVAAHWLRGLQPSPRYVAIGSGSRLFRSLGHLPGWRGHAESLCLRLPFPWHWAGPVTSAQILAALAALVAAVGTVEHALLLWTGYYKETALVGIVSSGDGPRFVKVFVDEADAQREVCRVAQLQEVLGGLATVAAVRHREGPVVVYDLLPRGHGRLGRRSLRGLALDLGEAALRRDGERARVEVREQAASVLGALEQIGLGAAARAYEQASGLALEVPMALAHGDLIRSNVFRAASGATCLVDYERVGRRPAFHDAFHLVSGERADDVSALVAVVADRAGLTRAEATQLAVANLTEEIATSVRYLRRYPGNRARNARLIDARGRALARLLQAG